MKNLFHTRDLCLRTLDTNSLCAKNVRRNEDKMNTIHLREDFIKLGQALKLAGLVESGVDAKFVIQDGLVKVNGETETRRGKKLVAGDMVEYNGDTFKVEA